MRELEREAPEAIAAPRGRAPLPRLAIIGAGRVGRSLTRAAREAGLPVRLAGREEALETARWAEAALLCVPDAAIGEASARLADAVPPLRLVGHVSGASGLDALAPTVARGAEAFSLHPLQTIPDGDTDLRGAPCAVSGWTHDALSFATDLAERLGMRAFAVPEDRRAAYHAAAAIASNFLIAAAESAAQLLERAGIEAPRELLTPLVLRTAANWSEQGAAALTGPIARGDEATVARHLDALREHAPELAPVYEALAERTRAIVESHRPEGDRR
jgi:predicted short-subunit dehydrogenase-like oxidoreductase (DUF2520 family)